MELRTTDGQYGTHYVGVTELQINGSTDFYGIKDMKKLKPDIQKSSRKSR